MTLLNLPIILAAAMVLRSVDAACVEDNCYGAMYWNPAGAEECSAHFITTVIPPPTTSTVTITSGLGDITTISGPFVSASTIVPSQVIPTYIVRACYGDVAYRFESACSCVGAGPTTITAPAPVATNTVIIPAIIPAISTPGISSRPLITASPVPGGGSRLPEPIIVGPGLAPACLAVGGGSVIVTVQVDEFFAMSLTVSGPVFCMGEPTAPPAQSSQCNCASTLPSSAPFFSSSRLAISNETSSSYSDTFSTVFRTSYTATSSERFSNYSTAASTEPTTSSPPETSSEFVPTTSSHSFLPFETRNFSTTEAPSSTEASSTEAPSSTEASSTEASSTEAPSTEASSSTAESSTSTSSSESSGPTPFAPLGPDIYIKITAGALVGQYLSTGEPDATTSTNLQTHVTADLDAASVWTLDRETGLLFQQIGDAWWAAYITFGTGTSYSSVLLLPADTVVGWLTEPVFQKEPVRCTIDYSADFALSCGLQHGYTSVTESDRCGWTVATALNQALKRICAGLQEVLLQAVVIYPEEEGISK